MSKPTNTETAKKSELVGTPRTDAEEFDAFDGQGFTAVNADFARQLETELNAIHHDWKEKCIEADTMRQHYKNAETELTNLKRQVAEAVERFDTTWTEKGLSEIRELIRDSQTENDTRTGVCRDGTRTGDSPLDRLAKQVDEAGLYDCETKTTTDLPQKLPVSLPKSVTKTTQ